MKKLHNLTFLLLLAATAAVVSGQLDGHLMEETEEDLGFEQYRRATGLLRNAIPHDGKRYKCYSCEPPACHESATGTHVCQNALQCWKSRVRDANGVERVSRGCTTKPDEIPFICNQNLGGGGPKRRRETSQFNIECCRGDYCNNGTFPELQPVNVVSKVESNDMYMVKLALAIFGPVFVLGSLAIVVILLLRRSHQKRLFAARNKDADSYYANQEENQLLRVTAPGDSTLKEYLQHSMTSGSGSGLPLLIQRTIAKQVGTFLVGKQIFYLLNIPANPLSLEYP